MEEILNERTYWISKSNISKLRADLEAAHRNPQHSSDKVRQKKIGELEQLVCSIADYDALKRAGGMRFEFDSLQDLGLALIKARISLGWSQERLARELDMTKQQIQRYESTEYASASFRRILEIADALGVSLSVTATTGSSLSPATELDAEILGKSLAGFSAVEIFQDIEKRIKLRVMTAHAARKIFDNLCDTYYQLSPFHQPSDMDTSWRLDHRLAVRKAMEILARERGEFQ
jgi:transcriptional regulator with XRE-family HTH domain